MKKFIKSVRKDRIVYELEIDCKKESTARNNFIKHFPECSWINEQFEEDDVLSREYDSYIVEHETDDHFYILAVIWSPISGNREEENEPINNNNMKEFNEQELEILYFATSVLHSEVYTGNVYTKIEETCKSLEFLQNQILRYNERLYHTKDEKQKERIKRFSASAEKRRSNLILELDSFLLENCSKYKEYKNNNK